jgi:hypothetical protein
LALAYYLGIYVYSTTYPSPPRPPEPPRGPVLGLPRGSPPPLGGPPRGTSRLTSILSLSLDFLLSSSSSLLVTSRRGNRVKVKDLVLLKKLRLGFLEELEVALGKSGTRPNSPIGSSHFLGGTLAIIDTRRFP